MQRAQQLGRYHLLDRIAYGGMAEIFRAKTFDSDGHAHLVAVKRVLSHLAEDDVFLQMLVDEAKIASLLDHPNIARVYEFSRDQGEYFIAMEHIDGKDLRSLLERGRQVGHRLTPYDAAWIVGEVAAALHAAHTVVDGQGRALRLVHRDVSPSNVILSYAGEVKLCDFGIAKATLSRTQTKTGVIKGKVKYMSPEQAMGRKLDHRSDLFSLGSVLYELLTNQPPFLAQNEMDLLIKIRDVQYPPARELDPDIPVELEAVVDRALTRSRSGRFQSGQEMRAALKDYLARHAPGYTRSHLAQTVRALFSEEIERELRLLEEYVIADAREDAGENLIADALPPNAAYSKFTPIAGSREPARPPPIPGAAAHPRPGSARARGQASPPAAPSAEPRRGANAGPHTAAIRRKTSGFPDIHNLSTQILDPNRAPLSTPRPPAPQASAPPVTPAGAPIHDTLPPGTPGSGGPYPSGHEPASADDGEVHDLPTRILDKG